MVEKEDLEELIIKKRIASAILIVAIFIPFLLIGGLPFTIFMSIIGMLGLYELIHIRESRKEFPLITKFFAFILFALLMFISYGNFDFQFSLDLRYVSLMIFLFLLPMVFINDTKKYNLNDALFQIGCVLFLGISFNLLILIREKSLEIIIYLLLIQTLTDTFALITGRLVGKHKLCPTISPKKTIEGAVGGTLVATFVSVAFYMTVCASSANIWFVILMTIILSIVGQLGDLVFSSIKRYYDKKDFSDLIPGHGGILDRFDSLIFISLAFIFIIEYMM